ncbi:ribonuclease H-like domain-containing protein [Tanacetum coccineum]|uniref:Ribonuclease H-like domain-containing protein n=1 Tax=Tanacetum coccineum TaxID=301880 RepID=A0ABQ4XI25_9ASTR
MAGSDDENSPPPPPPQQTPSHTKPSTLIILYGISIEDANQNILRSFPSSWSQVSLVMRTKPGVDNISFDDLYNNLRVFEYDVKGSTGSSSNHKDLEQLDEFDLEEMDLKWKVAMISVRLKKFYKKTAREERRVKETLEICALNQVVVEPNVVKLNLKFWSDVLSLRSMINTARQNLTSQAATTSTARKANTARPIVNEIRPRNNFYMSHSPIRRPFDRTTAPRTNVSNQKVNTAEVKVVSAVGGKRETAVKPSAALKNKVIVDSGCSRHMTGNKAYLAEYQDYNGGPVAFRGSKGYIAGKGKIKTGKLDFKDVCFVKELQHFNLFSVSQMCDKKNKVLFIDTECLVLSSDFKLPDENQVLLRVPRQNNIYSFNLKNIVSSEGLACLIAKAIVDESNKWHRRLGHVHFKNLNKFVKGNLVRACEIRDHANKTAEGPEEKIINVQVQKKFWMQEFSLGNGRWTLLKDYVVLPIRFSYIFKRQEHRSKEMKDVKHNKDIGFKDNVVGRRKIVRRENGERQGRGKKTKERERESGVIRARGGREEGAEAKE